METLQLLFVTLHYKPKNLFSCKNESKFSSDSVKERIRGEKKTERQSYIRFHRCFLREPTAELRPSSSGSFLIRSNATIVFDRRRGISNFYNGKSKSFTSLAEASSASSVKFY
ncbi:hypothetical protein QYF36_011354 [Acer negundo]|nr:hypothetical protein QYF36_011354 [Acer negundo]